MERLEAQVTIVQSDITIIEADAIVNSANKTLLGGGGVDGAIHYAAGPELLEECRALGGCKTGEAKATKAYNLPATHVIHTVGPFFGFENGREPELLASCYANSLALADTLRATSIAFPCISTSAFQYPKDQAAKVAVASVNEYLKANPQSVIETVLFVVRDELDYNLYHALLQGQEIDLSKFSQ